MEPEEPRSAGRGREGGRELRGLWSRLHCRTGCSHRGQLGHGSLQPSLGNLRGWGAGSPPGPPPGPPSLLGFPQFSLSLSGCSSLSYIFGTSVGTPAGGLSRVPAPVGRPPRKPSGRWCSGGIAAGTGGWPESPSPAEPGPRRGAGEMLCSGVSVADKDQLAPCWDQFDGILSWRG